MYKNVGNKIKVLAQWIGGFLLAAGVVAWMVYISNGTGYRAEADDYIGWICLGCGIGGFISSWFLYAFGQLVEDVHALRGIPEEEKMEETEERVEEVEEKVEEE